MRDVGFLYVLANSAMQGMVKVGKTTRSPAERAAELSAATGLPTPFIVVYEQLFEDCTEAETFVHTLLASKGFRVADNREFFSAPVNEVVRAIALAPGAIDEGVDQEDGEDADVIRTAAAGGTIANLKSPAPAHSEPWRAVYEEAENHYYGFGDYLEDYEEALRLYKQAAILGCLDAYLRLGQMHHLGDGVRADTNKALKYYKEGARKGLLYCYWRMGEIYLYAEAIKGPEGNEGISKTEKCFELYMKACRTQLGDKNESVLRFDLLVLDAICILSNDAPWRKFKDSKDILEIMNKIWRFFIEFREPLIRECERRIQLREEGDKMLEELGYGDMRTPGDVSIYQQLAEILRSKGAKANNVSQPSTPTVGTE